MISNKTKLIVVGTLIAGGLLIYDIASTVAYKQKTKAVIAEYESRIVSYEEQVNSLSEQSSSLKQEIDSLLGVEFKIQTPAGIELICESSLNTVDGKWSADIVVTDISVSATMATNFDIVGSQYSMSLRDFDLFARTVRAESGGMTLDSNVAVANVIQHRVDSPRFPDNYYDVIHQPFQFQVVEYGTYLQPPTNKAITAVAQAMNGVDYVPNALGFWADYVPPTHELWQYPVTHKYGSHVFSPL